MYGAMRAAAAWIDSREAAYVWPPSEPASALAVPLPWASLGGSAGILAMQAVCGKERRGSLGCSGSVRSCVRVAVAAGKTGPTEGVGAGCQERRLVQLLTRMLRGRRGRGLQGTKRGHTRRGVSGNAPVHLRSLARLVFAHPFSAIVGLIICVML